MTDESERLEADDTCDLLVRAEAGDPQAFDDLFARHRATLHRVAARRLGRCLRPRIDPSDVVQEAQIDALEGLADFIARWPMPFRVWLIKTAIQRLSKLQRHGLAARRDLGRERPLFENSSTGAANSKSTGGSSPSRQVAARELSVRFYAVFDKLSEPDRAILRLRALEGVTYEEAGARLRIEPAAARKRYGRALLRLRALLLADGLNESHL
jgi:RNA polymerase sigma-70 factor (ECF subfamily)